MQVTIKRQALLEALSQAVKIAKPSVVNITDHLLFEMEPARFIVKATDLSMFLTIKVKTQSIEGEAQVVVPARQLYSIVKNLFTDTLTLVISNEKFKVITEKNKFSLPIQSPEAFPLPPQPENPVTFAVSSEIFTDALRKTLVTTARRDGEQAEFKTIYIHCLKDKIRFVSSDSYRLCCQTIDADSPCNGRYFGIPRDVAQKIITFFQKDRQLNLSFSESIAEIKTENMSLCFSLSEASLFAYEQIIEADFVLEAIVPKEKLKKALEIAAELDSTGAARFIFDENTLTIQAEDDLYSAHQEIDIEAEGKPQFALRFNAQFFIELLSLVSDDVAAIKIGRPKNIPSQTERYYCHITEPDGSNFFSILMPLYEI